MQRTGNLLIIASSGLFVLFFANVVTGSMGKPVFLSDVMEMLVLFTACVVFVIAILFKEKAANNMAAASPIRDSREETD